MAPLHCINLPPKEKVTLLAFARRSIEHGLNTNQPLEVERSGLSGALSERCGNFVTLTQHDVLRGCIGTIEATRDHLAQSVAVNAFHAATHDSRFRPLLAEETDRIRIEISVLSRPEPLEINTLQELLATIRPYEDGLILKHKNNHATFLPKVWEKLPDPKEFISQLMAKAGLPADYWSDSVRFHRYRAVSFSESQAEATAQA